tara:strand:- start:461 stop:1210 length:750 start_codon:yes stop_codon:yes gene_type:complete
MIVYPNAKINLGLNVLRKREDGYHDISSVFYPVKECVDILEIIKSEEFEFTNSGISIPDGENLCEKAWKLLYTDFGIGNVKIHLHKQIAIGAGLGGGSADASFTLKALNKLFELHLTNIQLEKYALKLGADCPFFIDNTTKYVQGIGERMTSIDLDLSNYDIRLVNPDIHISTKEAFSWVVPKSPEIQVDEIIELPIIEWKGKLKNNFEESIFEKHLQLEGIKDELYKQGSIYSSMSGSGSIVFGIFEK